MKTNICTRAMILLTVVVTIFSIVSCKKNSAYTNGNAPKSSVNIYLADDPSLVFDKVMLDIQKVEVKVEDSSQAEAEHEHEAEIDDNDKHGDASGGWINIDIHPGVYDILQFRNGLDTLFAVTSFPATHALKKVRVTLGTNNSVVFNGTSFPLAINGNDNFIVIKIDESLTQINAGGLTNIWVDIDAGNSIRKKGNNFELKPSVKVFSKEKAGGIEGRVLPADANAVVMAINGSDTATAKPESEGEFKFIGLKSGAYTLVYHATNGGYIDQTVNGVSVSEKDDTKVATVTLQK